MPLAHLVCRHRVRLEAHGITANLGASSECLLSILMMPLQVAALPEADTAAKTLGHGYWNTGVEHETDESSFRNTGTLDLKSTSSQPEFNLESTSSQPGVNLESPWSR